METATTPTINTVTTHPGKPPPYQPSTPLPPILGNCHHCTNHQHRYNSPKKLPPHHRTNHQHCYHPPQATATTIITTATTHPDNCHHRLYLVDRMETSSSVEERPSEMEMNGGDMFPILSKHRESSDLDEYEPGAEDEDEDEDEKSNQAEVVGYHNRWSSDGGKN
ncbi:hypothetical protein QZH41_004144 [Actinostola sp. cb2023]|nr:hypothetical protein QZH41_004144 [Actinostola sp. cb2023]